jgi:hypothetical protein
MSTRKKEVLGLLVCLLVAGLVLWRFTVLVTPKQHDYGATWGQFLQEEPDSIDVVFYGSSLTYCDIVPAVYWEGTELASYVVAGAELTVPMEKYYLLETLKTQSPQIAFFEISGALFGRYTNYTKTNIGQMPWGLNRLKATFCEAERENIGGLLFPMLFYHSRWSDLTNDDYQVAKQGYDQDMLAGYTYLGKYRSYEEIYTREVTLNEENIQRNLEMLRDIWQICRDRDITPVFYVAPVVARMPEEQMEALKSELEALEGAVVLDCNDYFEEIGADMDGDFYDFLHFNAAGAEKFSRFLAGWTVENLQTIQQERDAALWQERVDYFYEKLETPMEQAESE